MPFWKGDGPGRPLEFGRRIGALVRELRALPKPAALTRLVAEHDLDPGAAENLLQFLADQEAATGSVPDDRTIVIERCRDELGDWRVCVLTPFGSRIHIPWAMAVSARIRAAGGPEVETLWGDDGFVLRFPDTDEPPDPDWFLVESAEAMQLVLRQLGSTALFAGRFREAAGRALLLPRRRADARSPLWQLRKRSYDLLSVASRYPSFPLLLEAYRECLRDVFDMPALIETLRAIEQRQLRVHVVETRKPSPFAASLLFSYVANFLYDGDAPLAERRAQALTIDQDQLRELLGEADLRELLDADAIAEVEEAAQCLAETHRARSADGIHDLCLRLGDLSRDELARRVADPLLLESLTGSSARAACSSCASPASAASSPLKMRPAIATPSAFRCRPVWPPRCLSRSRIPSSNSSAAMPAPTAPSRCARLRNVSRSTPPPSKTRCASLPLKAASSKAASVPAAFIASGATRKSSARFAASRSPASPRSRARRAAHARPLSHPLAGPARPAPHRHANLDALLDAIESLQGAPLPASLLESSILPARIADYAPAGLDTLIAAGEVAWAGVEPIGERDGRIALFLADKLPLLAQQRPIIDPLTEREEKLLAVLESTGASFFDPLHQAARRRLSRRNHRCPLEPGLARPHHQRLAPRPARLHRPPRKRPHPAPPANGRLPLPPHHAAHRARPLVAAAAAVTAQGPRSSRVPLPCGVFQSQGWEQMKFRVPPVPRLWGPGIPRLHPQPLVPSVPQSLSPSVPTSHRSPATPSPSNSSTATASSSANPSPRKMFPADSAPSTTCSKLLKKAAAFAVAILSPASAQRSSRCPPPSICSASCAPRRPKRSPSSSNSPQPIPPTPTAPSSAGPTFPSPKKIQNQLRASSPAPPTLKSFCATASSSPGCAAAIPTCSSFFPPKSRSARRPPRASPTSSARAVRSACAHSAHQGVLITTINGQPVAAHPMARFLMDAGFHPGPLGMHLRRIPLAARHSIAIRTPHTAAEVQ